VFDVGGGSGAFLVAVLSAGPAVEDGPFDQPHVVARADAARSSGGLCRAILHDWRDADAGRILSSCRAAMDDALFAPHGFTLSRVIATGAPPAVVEGRPV